VWRSGPVRWSAAWRAIRARAAVAVGGAGRGGAGEAVHHLDTHASVVFEAAAAAHHATGSLIAVHLEGGTHPLGVLAELHSRRGVPASSVILSHLNRFPDPGPHREAAGAGVFLGFDGPSRANHATDWRLFDLLAALIGGDTTTAAARGSSGGGPAIPYLLTDIRARVIRHFGADTADAFFRRNPARAFDADWSG
jgi:5-phospho-D-xylono-1,4-lactonase